MNLPDALDSHQPLHAAQAIEEILTKLRISRELLHESTKHIKELYAYKLSNTAGQVPSRLSADIESSHRYMQELISHFYKLHLAAAYRECLTNVPKHEYTVLSKQDADLYEKMRHQGEKRMQFTPAKLDYV